MKSIVGLILGVVGAIGSLTLSLVLFLLYFVVRFGKTALIENNLSKTLIDFASSLSIWLLLLVVWFLVFGVLGIIFSSMMNRPGKVRKGGIGCLISGILGLNPFLLIGGIMGIFVGGISVPVQEQVYTASSSVPEALSGRQSSASVQTEQQSVQGQTSANSQQLIQPVPPQQSNLTPTEVADESVAEFQPPKKGVK